MNSLVFEVYTFNHRLKERGKVLASSPTMCSKGDSPEEHGLHFVMVALELLLSSCGLLFPTHCMLASSLHSCMASSQCPLCSFIAEHPGGGIRGQIKGEEFILVA